MPISEITDPKAVEDALVEFDRIGREAFLDRYGFGRSRQYFLRAHDGKLYDSKAIVGAAYGKQYPERGPLGAHDFSGGEATVKELLEGLNFAVVEAGNGPDGTQEGKTRNPAWIRDELILALDLYFDLAGRTFTHDSAEIIELSRLLNQLHGLLGTAHSATLRNANGVYMKLMNFRRFDPTFTEAGRHGLTRGNRLEEEVWRDFYRERARLAAVARAIRRQVTDADTEASSSNPTDYLDEDFEAPEGRILTKLHRQRERNRRLVEAKKSAVLSRYGALRCEVCSFDFGDIYGKRGQGFIECHHARAVETLTEHSRTNLTDLVLLCANCHRMIHARRPWITMQQLRAIVLEKNAPHVNDL